MRRQRPDAATHTNLGRPESPLDARTRNVNVYAQQLIRSADQNNPFQYYELLGVQWPTNQCHTTTPCIGISAKKRRRCRTELLPPQPW